MVAQSGNSFALAFLFSKFPKGNLTRETVMCHTAADLVNFLYYATGFV